MIRTEKISYQSADDLFEGTVSWNDSQDGKRPGVLICHAFGGQSLFDTEKAQLLAELGYVGFALDLYGKGRRATSPAEANSLMAELNDDRSLLLDRMLLSADTLRQLPQVDENRIAAIGYCFGGKCVLDLARSGADIRGIVSFHGLYDPPPQKADVPYLASTLILHGWDDPLGPPKQVVALAEELSGRGADWQICAYGGTGHSFSNPKANAPESGIMYNAESDARAWRAMQSFLEEVLR